MIRSGHVDTFARDNLPPRDQWPEFRFTLPELQYPERLNCVTEFVDKWVRMATATAPRSCRPAETLTYAQLAERINRIANVLTRDLGMVPGNRVLLRAPNTPMAIACYLAVIKAGGVDGRHHAAAARQGAVVRRSPRRRSSSRCATHGLSDEMEKTKAARP